MMNELEYKSKQQILEEASQMAMSLHQSWLILKDINRICRELAVQMEEGKLIGVLNDHMETYRKLAGMTEQWKNYNMTIETQEL